jgi:dTDP-4-amino-4,6-dideoxygalactose transaminase
VSRNELMRRLHRVGIATRRGIMAIHHERAYAGTIARLPHTDAAAEEVLLLPLFPGLPQESQELVVDRLAENVLARAA